VHPWVVQYFSTRIYSPVWQRAPKNWHVR
jgi:hypothetical protein